MITPADLEARLTEAQWQSRVLAAFRLFGWRVFVDRVAYRSDPGWPDIFAIHAGQRRCIWVELKSERGKLSPAQLDWGDALILAGQEWYCWKPSDFDRAVLVMRGARP